MTAVSRANRWEALSPLILSGLTLSLNFWLVYVVVFQVNFFFPDTMSRARIAWQVFFSRDPKLANIGFVWSPLPTLLQLPLVLFANLRAQGLSANVLTAVCGVLAANLVWRLARSTQLPLAVRWLWVATFVLNPMILFYAANGMSEMLSIVWVLGAVYGYWGWVETKGRWFFLSLASAMMGLAFLTRYETAVMALLLGVFVWWQAYWWKRDTPVFAESSVLLYGVPLGYMVVLWLLVSWVIVGDPLYFARSPYSNAGQIAYQLAGAQQWLLPLKGNWWAALQATFGRTWNLFPAFVLVSGLLLSVLVVKRAWRLGVWLSVAWCFPLFMAVYVYLGQTAFFLRYFILIIPFTFVLAMAVVQNLRPAQRTGVALGLALVFVWSGYCSLQTMLTTTEGGEWNDVFWRGWLQGERDRTFDDERTLANYLNTQTEGIILADDFQAGRIIFFTAAPERFMVSSDPEFRATLKAPAGKVDYILASRQLTEGTLNQVNLTYPDLYEKGALDMILEKELGVWRLYRLSVRRQVPSVTSVPIDQTTDLQLTRVLIICLLLLFMTALIAVLVRRRLKR